MQIEIWSDVVCPWCYIGKRRLEAALAEFPHRDEVEIRWRSFELDPTTRREGDESNLERLASKLGLSERQAQELEDRVQGVAAGAGLDYHLELTRPTNTFDVHRVLHLAADEGVQDAAKEGFLAAHFVEGRDLQDPETVVAVATAAGADEAEVRRVLADPTAYADAVLEDRREAAALGAEGVPFFVFDRRYGVSGAQPVAQFAAVLERAWADEHAVTGA